jgi:3-oxoacyl-[acyl-carrier-protein] synthase-3
MRCEDLFVAGIGTWLPEPVSVEAAVADGRYDAEEHELYRYEAITVAGEPDPPPEMAIRAGRLAVQRSGRPPGDTALLLHASAWYQGIDYWPAASYIQRNVVGDADNCLAVDVQQMSNGVLAGTELAVGYLAADPSRAAALVTAAERYHLPGVDRWRSGVPGIVYGDGGAAWVLARGGGFARLLSIATVTDTALEGLYRGDEPYGKVSGQAGHPIDIRRRRREHMATTSHQDIVRRTTEGMTKAIERALSDAGLRLVDITRTVFPGIGLAPLRSRYLEPLGLDLEASLWECSRRTGHVGSADQLIGLAHLVESARLRPGERVMLVGIGAGFAWSCAVIEMVRQPDW